jgi:Zn-dependent protease with chaperone function
MIERLCVQADLPKPEVAVVNTRMPNAFALGRSPKHATGGRHHRHHGAAEPRPSSRA